MEVCVYLRCTRLLAYLLSEKDSNDIDDLVHIHLCLCTKVKVYDCMT